MGVLSDLLQRIDQLQRVLTRLRQLAQEALAEHAVFIVGVLHHIIKTQLEFRNQVRQSLQRYIVHPLVTQSSPGQFRELGQHPRHVSRAQAPGLLHAQVRLLPEPCNVHGGFFRLALLLVDLFLGEIQQRRQPPSALYLTFKACQLSLLKCTQADESAKVIA